jgi:ribosomal protein S18 acetylase RimI-like enzyme
LEAALGQRIFAMNEPLTPAIARLGPGDEPVLLAFLRAAGEPDDENAARGLLAEPGFWCLLARVDGQPAGLAGAARLPKWDTRRGFLFVDELLVLPAFRRRGVARALLARLEALARAQGLAGLRLLARPGNAAAQTLYTSAGFTQSGTVFCEKVLEGT